MRKMYGMLAVAGILLAMIPASVMAAPVIEVDEDAAICEDAGYVEQYKEKYGPLNAADTQIVGKERIKNRNLVRQKYSDENGPTADLAPKKVAKLRGIWGFAGDNESDGYFAGRLVRRNRVGVFKGVYNKTDNESQGKIFGIMKKGYFNGAIITPNGERIRITGLYKIDVEDKTFKLRWMASYAAGWAAAKIVVPEV